MRLLFMLLIAVFLRAEYEYKIFHEFKNSYVLLAKKIGDQIYFYRNVSFKFNCKLKNFFLINNEEFDVCTKNSEIRVMLVRDDVDVQKIKIPGIYTDSLQNGDKIYIASKNSVYVISKNLSYKKISFPFAIDSLAKYKGRVYVISGLKFYTLDKKVKFDFTKQILSSGVDFYVFNDQIFALYKDPLAIPIKMAYPDSLVKMYTIKNLTDNYVISFYERPKILNYFDSTLFVLNGETLEAYKYGKFLFSYDVGYGVRFLFKENNDLVLYYDDKVVLLKKKKAPVSNCISVGYMPLKLAFFKNMIVVLSHKDNYLLSFYDKKFKPLFKRTINQKINALRVFDGSLYLIGAKDGRFWVGKMDRKGKIIRENTFFDAAQGFDILKTRYGFLAVGYKYFDHLGKYIKRIVFVRMDENLNLVDDKTYSDSDSAGFRLIRAKDGIYGYGDNDGDILLYKVSENGFLKWYKIVYDKRVYDMKYTGDSVVYSTDNGLFEIKNGEVNKFKDLSIVMKIFAKYTYFVDDLHSDDAYFYNDGKKVVLKKLFIIDALRYDGKYVLLSRDYDYYGKICEFINTP